MQNPEDALVRPDYELILCIDYLLKVRDRVKIFRFFLFMFLTNPFDQLFDRIF